MQVQFKQAAHICGKDYSRGFHQVSEDVMQSKFFLKLVNAGLVLDAEEAKMVSAEPLHARQARLAEKLAADAKAAAALNAPVSPGIESALGQVELASGQDDTVKTMLDSLPEDDQSFDAVEVAEQVEEKSKPKSKSKR